MNVNMNAKIWKERRTTRTYSMLHGLQKPERKAFNTIFSASSKMSILDIGVGCGGTTHFLAPYASLYVGLDCSPGMIKACRNGRVSSENIEFIVGDA
jgi:ubiquinone/menaquinone biosynthesis C-methylase UbiE